jgi:hypothetical protein
VYWLITFVNVVLASIWCTTEPPLCVFFFVLFLPRFTLLVCFPSLSPPRPKGQEDDMLSFIFKESKNGAMFMFLECYMYPLDGVFSCLVLSCLALFLSCLVLSCSCSCSCSCLVLSCLVLSCSCSCLVLSCPVLSCPVLSRPVVSCRVVSCPVLSCLVLSCLVNASCTL